MHWTQELLCNPGSVYFEGTYPIPHQRHVPYPGGVIGPTQWPCVYLLVEGTTWITRNRSMKGIFKELFNILSFFKSQICVHILPCVYHIFIVMINQMAKSFGDM